MEKKELGKEISTFLVNIYKPIRKERIRTLCLLGCSALVIGTVLGFLLGHGYTQKLQNGLISAHFEETGSTGGQQETGASSVDSASMSQPTEIATVPVSQAEPDAPSVMESRNIESTSIPQPTEPVDISTQQAELGVPPVTESQSIESASMSQSTEYSNIQDSKPGNPKRTLAKKRKLKSADKRRAVHRKIQCVTYISERQNYHYGFPAYSH